MAFVFSLAAVLTVRRQREDAEERRFGAIARELEQTRNNLARVQAELNNLAQQSSAARPETMQGTALHERYARVGLLRQAGTELEACLVEVAGRRDAQKAIFLSARRDRELLEDLEHRQRASFNADALRREQRRNDDLFLARRLRG